MVSVGATAPGCRYPKRGGWLIALTPSSDQPNWSDQLTSEPDWSDQLTDYCSQVAEPLLWLVGCNDYHYAASMLHCNNPTDNEGIVQCNMLVSWARCLRGYAPRVCERVRQGGSTYNRML